MTMRIDRDLTAASVVPLLLLLLEREDSYGYQIIQRIKASSQHQWTWSEGMLYPVLHRLEQRELIESYWREATTGRKRKYYRLTQRGRVELERLRKQWEVVQKTLSNLGFSAPSSAGKEDVPHGCGEQHRCLEDGDSDEEPPLS
jgi:DNA-binding PadR family transcriptional regulator